MQYQELNLGLLHAESIVCNLLSYLFRHLDFFLIMFALFQKNPNLGLTKAMLLLLSTLLDASVIKKDFSYLVGREIISRDV